MTPEEIIVALLDFIKNNPYPKGQAVHKFAEENHIQPTEVETMAYAIISAFWCGGDSRKEGLNLNNVDQRELMLGIMVEREHVSLKENCPYQILRDIIPAKIGIDHIASIRNYYSKPELIPHEIMKETKRG